MFTISCLFFFAGFVLWMNTSKRISWTNKESLLLKLENQPVQSKYLVVLLFIIGTVIIISKLGIGSGLFAAVVILMAMGSICVLFFPFRYFGLKTILLSFLATFVLELIFN